MRWSCQYCSISGHLLPCDRIGRSTAKPFKCNKFRPIGSETVTGNLLPWATKRTHPSQYSFSEYSGWLSFGRILFKDVVRKVLIPAKFPGMGWIKLRWKQSYKDNHAKKVQQNLQISSGRAPDRNWCKISLLGKVERISNRTSRG